MLDALERGFKNFGIDYYLVGAVARDIWLQAINDIKPSRTTKDIDLGVLINDKGKFELLRAYLVENENFIPTHDNAFALLWNDRIIIDLMPFGAIEDFDGSVTVTGTGFTNIDVPAFKEIYLSGLPKIELEDKHQFKCCTLPGIVILKLLAWEDRPEIRQTDLIDICEILNHYFEINDNEIWENHSDLFTDEDVELIQVSATVLGREIKKIINTNQNIYTRLQKLIRFNIKDSINSRMIRIMTQYFENSIETNCVILENLLRGIQE
ncbi:hypothetical protein [Arachidicoccus rhizosphaerae]|nr:hypothetical protein [Arachidicoccus rhizosphaerae]